MNNISQQRTEKGQNLVIFALIFVGLIAVVALLIDGGFVLARRRTAQAAADAAALAAAEEYCRGDAFDAASAEIVASTYAGINEAGLAPGGFSADPSTRRVTVTTLINHDSFFAHVIGFPIIPVPMFVSCPFLYLLTSIYLRASRF